MRSGWKRFHEMGEQSGQSSVEYAVVLFGFLAMLLALGVLATKGSQGMFSAQAQRAASHSTGSSSLGALQDTLLY